MTDHYVSMAQIRASKKQKDRPPPSLQDVFGEDPYSEISFAEEEEEATTDIDTPSSSGASSSGQSGQSGQPEQPYEVYIPATRKAVLQPGPSGLGMSVAGGVMSPAGLLPVFVTDIDPGGEVEKSETIKVGDCIMRVNGESMEGKSHREVVLAIMGAGDSLMLEVTEAPENIQKYVAMAK